MNLTSTMTPAAVPMTMSTREIAELLGKTHSNIKISAERMQATGVIGTLAVQEFEHNGNIYTEYLLEKRDSLILVAQNSPEFTARIVDRWQELEAQQAPKLPQTMAQALRLAAEQAGKMTPHAEHLAAGRFKMKTGTAKLTDHAYAQAKFTPKGVEWIAGLWGQHKARLAQEGGTSA